MESQKPQPTVHKMSGFALWVVVAAAFGGILFGYDQGVMSGALKFLTASFKLGAGMEGFLSGSVPLGAMIGCIFAGILADFWGRRPTLFTAAALFIIASFVLGASTSVAILVIFRLISGFAIGMASTLVPLYVSEMAPAHIRGRLVAGYQLAIVTGALIVYLINYFIVLAHPNPSATVINHWLLSDGWRYMFYAGAVPGIIFFILLFFVPESLRFMLRKNRDADAKSVVKRMSVGLTDEEADSEISVIKNQLAEENKGMWSELLQKGFRGALIVGIFIGIFQQLTGTNAIGYYGPMIFADAGLGQNASMFYTVGIGLVKVIMVIILMLVIDKVGRKLLMIIGASGMALMMFSLAAAFTQVHSFTNAAGQAMASAPGFIGAIIIAGVLIHTTFYEFSFGGGAWVLISEIFPTRIRGRAMSICSFMLWGATYAVTQLFPMMVAAWGSTVTYLIFGCFCVIMGFFAKFAIHETRGCLWSKFRLRRRNAEARD